MDQWLAAIERNEPPHLTVDDERNLTQLLEAAYHSAVAQGIFRTFIGV